MKKIMTLIIASLVLVSCSEKKEEKVLEVKVSEKKEEIKKSEFSNPAIIYGTDFLSFFKSLRKLGQYDKMISFTSLESIEKFGKEELKKKYENEFVNMSNSSLKSMDKIDENTYVMHYLNSEFSTKKAFDITVKVENDSTKLVFENKYPF
jgi:hypothetical protein